MRSLEVIVTTPPARAFGALQRYRPTFTRLADVQMTPAVMAYTIPHLVRICLGLGERQWVQELVEAVRLRSPSPGEPLLRRAMLLEALRLAERLDLAIPFLAEEQRRDLLHAGWGCFGRHEPFVQQLLARHTRPSHRGEHGLEPDHR